VWSHMEPRRDDMALERHSNVFSSTDRGKTWDRLGGADVPDRSFDEHMIVERRDGSLWMLVRTRHGVGQAASQDGGRSWQAANDDAFPGPNSRFFVRRLRSGRLLLVNHDSWPEWTRVCGQVKRPADRPPRTIRKDLSAMLSEDDGKTWSRGLMLDARAQVSYPDGTQAPDGRILVVYDRERHDAREILVASLTEEDILAGRLQSPESRLAMLVNRAGLH
jgi:hypothetical protein